MSNKTTIRERLARLEQWSKDIDRRVGIIDAKLCEMHSDVKKILYNSGTRKGMSTVWSKIWGIILATVAGFLAGKFGR